MASLRVVNLRHLRRCKLIHNSSPFGTGEAVLLPPLPLLPHQPMMAITAQHFMVFFGLTKSYPYCWSQSPLQ
jgi:hypothetical protein